MKNLRDKVVFITGGSRGIGKAIGIRAAKDGASVVIAAKTIEPHAKLSGTIYTAAADIEKAGGKALAVALDVRDETQIHQAIEQTIKTFGRIDILVNNAGAIGLTKTLDTPIKRFDLMHAVNVRGTFACSQACIPYLRKSENPHILNLSPPLKLLAKWFAPHLAYTLSKYGMSLCVLGMAEEFRKDGIAVNALWPKTTIATAAISNLMGDQIAKRSRTPDFVADAAYEILLQNSRECTGNFFIDEEVLTAAGTTDFSRYLVEPGAVLEADLFI